MSIDLSSIEARDEYNDYEQQQPANNMPNREYDMSEQDMSIPPVEETADIQPAAQDESGDPPNIVKRRKILTLQFYLNEFPEKLKKYQKDNLEKLTIEELTALQDEFNFVIGCKSNVKVCVSTFIQGVAMLELACNNYTPIRAKGLTQQVASDSDLLDDVKAVALKHMQLVNIQPEQRVLYKLSTAILQLHTFNTFTEQQNSAKAQTEEYKPQPENKVSHAKQAKIEKTNQKFADL